MSNGKRNYHSNIRSAQAIKTRNRILTCAKKLFQTEGFECVTIEKLAQTADVSAPTIYSLFQSKRGIFRALMDEALPSDQYENLMQEVKNEKTAKGLLLLAGKIARCLYDAEKKQMAAFQGAVVLAPEFKELEKERETGRYKRLERTMQFVAKQRSLKTGLSESEAYDILWAFTGRDLYRMLVIERKWTSEAYEKWLAQHLINTLL